MDARGLRRRRAAAPRLSLPSLLAVDVGVRTGLAVFRDDGRLIWYRSRNFGAAARLKRAIPALLHEAFDPTYVVLEGGGPLAEHWATTAERHAKLVAFLEASPGAPARDTAGAQADSAPNVNGRGPLDRLLVKEEGRMYFVPVVEIDWIEAFGNYARLHTGPRTHLIRETMTTLERALDARRFARIHRSTIVNLDRIRQMDLWGSGDYMVRLADGTQLKLSRWYRDRLEARMRP